MNEAISPELRKALRHLKLSPVLDTLPERLVLARQQSMPHQDFLELILADEISRRERLAVERRARVAHLDPTMVLEAWDESTPVRFDRQLWNELCSLRFLEDASCVLILGPVGVGKTMLANCLGHIATRRQRSVLMFRTERLLKRLKAARLEGTHEQDASQDFYEIVVERHRRASLLVVSNREPQEWLATMADPLLAQSAVDRVLNSAYELVLDGESYRRRQKPTRGAP